MILYIIQIVCCHNQKRRHSLVVFMSERTGIPDFIFNKLFHILIYVQLYFLVSAHNHFQKQCIISTWAIGLTTLTICTNQKISSVHLFQQSSVTHRMNIFCIFSSFFRIIYLFLPQVLCVYVYLFWKNIKPLLCSRNCVQCCEYLMNQYKILFFASKFQKVWGIDNQLQNNLTYAEIVALEQS